MKNYRPVIILSTSILVLMSLLFGHVSGGKAQEEDWTIPVNLSLSGLATDPILFMDFQGKLHVIWTDDETKYKYSQSTDDGTTWSTPQTATFPFNPKSMPPKIIADATGAIHIFWIDKDGSLLYGQTTPANFIDQEQWTTNRRLASKVLNYDVVQDRQGALQLTYIHNASGLANPAGIFFTHTVPGAGGWSDPINLYVSDYFRSARASEAFLRIAVSNTGPVQDIYVTWDSRPQKRVFMASSEDGGVTWAAAREVKGPQDTGGVGSPFNLNVAASGDSVLLIWQIGEPGSGKCSVSSQWSTDRGQTWGEINTIPGAATDCPDKTQFISEGEKYMVIQMSGQGDPILMAWDGARWSDPQGQAWLPTLTNPLTYDAILMGCRFDLIHEDRLYVVGCDQGGGGDAWFLSRTLRPVEEWFAPLEAWSAPMLLYGDSAQISSLTSVTDSQGVFHSAWARTMASSDGSTVHTIEYAQWTGSEWSRPGTVIPDMEGLPTDLAFAVQGEEKLLLCWVDGSRGDILFSWVNVDKASLSSEWSAVVGLPAPSNLVSSPKMVVDDAGRIVVVYAVPLNEYRGIYVVQSTDSGHTWSTPVKVFDAVEVKWDQVENPHISLDQNGGLHVTFQRSSARSGESLGLFYTYSEDGGTTWSEPQIISEGNIQWNGIISYNKQTVHVLWQEYDGLVFANLSQISRDGGKTWSRPYSITGVNNEATPVSAALDSRGTIHFVQLLRNGGAVSIKQEDLTLQDWIWDGSNWSLGSDRNLSIRGEGLGFSVSSGVTSAGTELALVMAKYSDPGNQIQEEVLAFSRFLGQTVEQNDLPMVMIPTPVALPTQTEAPIIQPTQPIDPNVLYDDNVSTSSSQRNLIGMGIIGSVLVVTAVLLIRRRPVSGKK